MVLLLALAVSACQGTATRDESSSRYEVPEGSTLVLQRPLRVEPGSSRAHVQFGQPVGFSEVRWRHPVCIFLLDTPSEAARSIEPDAFTVVRTRRYRRISLRPSERRLAQVGIGIGIGGGFGDGGSDETFRTRMTLQSARQPGVRELICELRTTTADVMRDHLSIREIRATLGEVAQLRIPQGAPGLKNTGLRPTLGRWGPAG